MSLTALITIACVITCRIFDWRCRAVLLKEEKKKKGISVAPVPVSVPPWKIVRSESGVLEIRAECNHAFRTILTHDIQFVKTPRSIIPLYPLKAPCLPLCHYVPLCHTESLAKDRAYHTTSQVARAGITVPLRLQDFCRLRGGQCEYKLG